MQTSGVWRDLSRSSAERVADLLAQMTLAEKIGQLYGVWVGLAATEDAVAPHQHDFADALPDWKPLIENGLGQLTRPFGTVPTDPAVGARALARTQAEIIAAGRFGVPALVHEECLSGFTAWGATIFPTPLAWGATFDPELIEKMTLAIGTSMRGVGVHQGLAPVLDVCRDPRWGRTEETIGEDPYLVGTIGAAYVRGLESAGIVATLKHFVGYSASRGGRNLGPTSVGARELADVLLPPFEHAVRAGARSVMHSYTELDGVPTASDDSLLSGLLRDTWGFSGTVVADYFAVSFLHLLHGVAASPAEAARLALSAGIDVELPTVRCFGDPLLQAVVDGKVDEALIDRAAERVLRQKCELGLLDPDWDPTPESVRDEGEEIRGTVDFDPPASRAIARQLAEESVVLLQNKDILPLQAGTARVALVGPLADDPMAMLGCYTFPSHVGSRYPDLPLGVVVPTLRSALADELPASEVDYALGCEVLSPDRSGIEAAVALARSADVCVAVVGDRAGLFGRGTSGEGCDAEDLSLPGEQSALVEALLDTGTPVVLVLLTGRPYALGAYADRTAAIVQAFFPGEEGANAVAGVLSGRVNPSGRLPIGVPRRPGGQPYSYLAPPLGQRSEVSNLDPTPLFPFGHGLSYTSFEWSEPAVSAESFGTDEAVSVELAVRNVGDRAGTEVVQLYLHDPVAQVTRPVARLIGYARVPLGPGEQARVCFDVHADLTSFTGRRGVRVVEPGDLELRLSTACTVDRHVMRVRLVDKEREIDHRRHLVAGVRVDHTTAGGDG